MEELEYKGYLIKLEQDEFAESPDEWENSDIFLVYDHRDFTVKRDGFEPRALFDFINLPPQPERKDFDNEDDFCLAVNDWAEEHNSNYLEYYIFPVDAYIHSGVHLSLANTYPYPDRRWDVSTTGFIVVHKTQWNFDNCRKGLPELADKTDKEIARHYAEGNIKSWNQYLGGDIYYMEVYDKEETLLDSCSGFYGQESAIEEAKSNIDAIIEANGREIERITLYNRLTYLMRIDALFVLISGLAAVLTIIYATITINQSRNKTEFLLLIAFIEVCCALYYDSKYEIRKKQRDGYAANR